MLTQLSLTAQISWAIQATTGNFNLPAQQDSESFSLASLNLTTFNQLYANTFTIAAGAYNEFSLLNFADLVNETVSLGHALTLFILPTGAASTLEPGSTNGLTWFFQGTSPALILPNGGLFLYSLPATATGQAVTSTANTLRITNTDTTSLSVIVLLLGGNP